MSRVDLNRFHVLNRSADSVVDHSLPLFRHGPIDGVGNLTGLGFPNRAVDRVRNLTGFGFPLRSIDGVGNLTGLGFPDRAVDRVRNLTRFGFPMRSIDRVRNLTNLVLPLRSINGVRDFTRLGFPMRAVDRVVHRSVVSLANRSRYRVRYIPVLRFADVTSRVDGLRLHNRLIDRAVYGVLLLFVNYPAAAAHDSVGLVSGPRGAGRSRTRGHASA